MPSAADGTGQRRYRVAFLIILLVIILITVCAGIYGVRRKTLCFSAGI